MRLAKNALVIALTMLALLVAVSAQTLRSQDDARNIAPTVGTGGPVGGPTGLFTVYDGQTLRRGEFTFSAAYSNFDRDPGDADITEFPVSFQVGLSDHVELFFNTDAYRYVKINSPQNLSSFSLPNSRINGVSPAAIVQCPQGPGTALNTGACFRPAGTQPFVQFPFVGGATGNFGFAPAFQPGIGTGFGFPAGTSPTLGVRQTGGNGADNFPGIGSVFGSILPGVVLQTAPVVGGLVTTTPVVFSTAPSYLPDAPFINRTYGESSFNTFTIGAKFRFTGPGSATGIGLIPFYRFYADNANDFSGFNQMQRGSGPGAGGFNPFSSNRGDIGLILFADSRLRKWVNLSGNLGYIYNSSVKADFGGSDDVTLLDRGDEVLYGVALDFPVNKYFQPILEFRGTKYVGGRTPNAFENDPMDGVGGFRVFPARWFGFGAAYRHHFNQQDRDSIEDTNFNGTVTANNGVLNPFAPGALGFTTTTRTGDLSSAFRTSSNPHGFIFQVFAGHRNARGARDVVNQAANVTALDLDQTQVFLPCAPGFRSSEAGCGDDQSVGVKTTAVDPENDVLTYSYTVSGGRITGQGANVNWDLSGVRPGTYTITSAVDDGCGFCGQPKTQTITVSECTGCVQECVCPTLSVTGPSGVTNPGDTITFTANVSGGTATNVTYNWTVTGGTITEGQGTPAIRVATTPDLAGQNVTATVNIGGIDTSCNCTTTASETAGIQTPPGARKVNDFGNVPNDEVKQNVDNFFIELNNDPTATGTIINYGTDREVARRIAQINAAIRFRKYDASRVTFVRGGSEPGIRTEFYVVPSGAAQPTPGM